MIADSRISHILRTDSYKFSHFLQYPPRTTEVTAYIEARKALDFGDGKIVFFGLQAFINEYLSKPIYDLEIDQARDLVKRHGLPFNEEGWRRIVRLHNGYLPLHIEALPEGTCVNPGVPLVQLWNVDPTMPWLTTYIETQLLRAIWYPTTVATLSRAVKRIIYNGLLRSSDDPDGQIPFKLHDFGARGCASAEQAGIGGAAHLINFMGTDTFEGIMFARHHYGADMPGFSIPAAEHSTITAWGRDDEERAYLNMLAQFSGKDRMVAVVSDSYDLKHAVDVIWGSHLKDEVLRQRGVVVIRPDSGDPVATPLWVVRTLADRFGAHQNRKGFWVLNRAVRVIQGDGMTPKTISMLIDRMIDARLSIDNIAFGMGGGLLQQVSRDTLSFAMKANEVVVNGERRPIAKDPKTDPRKASKSGQQAVIAMADGTLVSAPTAPDQHNLLEPVWSWGNFNRRETFDDIRRRAALTPAQA